MTEPDPEIARRTPLERHLRRPVSDTRGRFKSLWHRPGARRTGFQMTTTGKHGGDRKSDEAIKSDNVTLDDDRGNSRAYTLDRLKRDHPEIA